MGLSASETDKGGAPGFQARALAAGVLKAVLHNRQPFDEAFAEASTKLPYSGLASRDIAFSRAISTAAIRRHGQIDRLLGQFLERPLPRDALDVRFILLAGLAELLFLDVAPHAAIGIAVSLAKAQPATARLAGFVNAVLRRASREGKTLLAAQDGVALNTPAWLLSRWSKHFGAEAASRIAAANGDEPQLDLTIKTGRSGWAGRLGGTPFPWGGMRLPGRGRIEDIDGFGEGEWWVQDAAAAIPALLLGDAAGLRIADLCASPGGKTAQLSAAGASVTAVDKSKSRLRRLRENLGRLHLEADIVEADASAWKPGCLFDAVLLDAPCSATGTIRRHPDIPYLKSEADIAALSKVQERLLANAVDLVRPGGTLVYCTCSLEPEEGIEQITRLLDARPDVVLDPILPAGYRIPVEFVSAGTLRTFPFYRPLGPDGGGMDGFFAARLRRSS